MNKLKQTLLPKNLIKSLATLFPLMLVIGNTFAGGLTRARGVLETLQSEIIVVIPIVAVIALVLLGVGYAMKIIDKDSLVRWFIGIVIVGSAVEIVGMLLT